MFNGQCGKCGENKPMKQYKSYPDCARAKEHAKTCGCVILKSEVEKFSKS